MKRSFSVVVLIVVFASNLNAINIDEAVEQALVNNNNIKKQQYIYDESKESINLSKAAYKPQLNLGYTYNTYDKNLGQGRDNSNASAVITYNLFNGLSDMYNLQSSRNLADTSMYNLKAAKHDLILRTKQKYINYLKSLKNIQTKKNAFKLLEQQYKDSENRFEQGLLAKNDLLQVNAQMLQAKQDLERAYANSRISRFELKKILGGKLDENENIEDLAKEVVSIDGYNIQELENRSEIRAVKKIIESLKNQKRANKGDFLPSADLNLLYTKFGDNASLEVDNDVEEEQKTATITLTWNLYSSGIDSTQDIIFQKKILQTKEDLEELKLSVKLQYENALEEFNVSKLNYQTAKISLEQSKENYKIVNNRFKEGLSSSTDLINANFLLSQAKQSFDNAFYNRFLAKAALDRIFEK